MKTLILLSGKARCGKDSAANYLMEHLNNATHLDITGQLKSELGVLIGKDVKWIDDNKDKSIFEGASIRSMMQRFGNDIIKKILFKDYWLQERLSRIQDSDAEVVLLSGVRMVREVEYYQKNFSGSEKRVITVKITRINEDGSKFEGLKGEDRYHITETDVERIEADVDIVAASLPALYSRLDGFINTNL